MNQSRKRNLKLSAAFANSPRSATHHALCEPAPSRAPSPAKFLQRSSLCALLLFLLAATAAPATVGEPQPPASFRDLAGATHTLAELRGHPAVINFWATWCLPCREEMPRLQHQATLYTPRGVQFIAISIDDPATQSKIPALVQKRDFHLPVWVGGTARTLLDLHLGEVVPATLVLDENGKPIGIIRGEAREKDIQSRLDWLLNGRPSPPPRLVQRNDW